MNCRAKLTTESKDARAVAAAISADNVKMAALHVRTSVEGGRVVTEVEAESVGTLMATLDDVLRCQITSESLI